MAVQYLPIALQLGEVAIRGYGDHLRSADHAQSAAADIAAIRATAEIEAARQDGRTERAAIQAQLDAQLEPIREQARTERAAIEARLSALRIQHENDIQNKLIALETQRTERHYALCTHMLEASERVYKSKIEAFTESYRATRSVLEAELAATRSELESFKNLQYDSSLNNDDKRRVISQSGELRRYIAQLTSDLERNRIAFDNQISELNLDIETPATTPLFYQGDQ